MRELLEQVLVVCVSGTPSEMVEPLRERPYVIAYWMPRCDPPENVSIESVLSVIRAAIIDTWVFHGLNTPEQLVSGFTARITPNPSHASSCGVREDLYDKLMYAVNRTLSHRASAQDVDIALELGFNRVSNYPGYGAPRLAGVQVMSYGRPMPIQPGTPQESQNRASWYGLMYHKFVAKTF